MRPSVSTILAVLALASLGASPLSAQLNLPGVPGVGGVVQDVTDNLGKTVETADGIATREATRLLRLREQTLERLLRRHGDVIERDAAGDLARRGEVLATAPRDEEVAALEQAGFRVAERSMIEGLEIEVVRLMVPAGMTLARAQRLAGEVAPQVEVSADNLYRPTGSSAPTGAPASTSRTLAARSGAISVPAIGMIDGAAGKALAISVQKGFARGAPVPSDHGSAVASLLLATGVLQVWVADVYGTDPAGGNALAIAKAMGWLTAGGCKVVTISLVGPDNPLIAKAVAAARKRGVVVLAAVGNDGPAAPPAYPASYAGVLAITGVDRKGRALIEAGRALHVDYAAPGAEVRAADASGRMRLWRGTSFATPLAAARVAEALASDTDWRIALDREARDLGRKGPDATYGRGLLCEGCARKK